MFTYSSVVAASICPPHGILELIWGIHVGNPDAVVDEFARLPVEPDAAAHRAVDVLVDVVEIGIANRNAQTCGFYAVAEAPEVSVADVVLELGCGGIDSLDQFNVFLVDTHSRSFGWLLFR